MGTIFDGKKYAAEMENNLQQQIAAGNRQLKIVSFLDENNPGSVMYSRLKANAAKRLGIEFIQETVLTVDRIQALNADQTVNGIMVQLPFPSSQAAINAISPTKDIDGLLANSPYKPAVVVAVKKILTYSGFESGKIVVVGAQGSVGSRLVGELEAEGMDKNDFDPKVLLGADVVVSATGQAGIITANIVKDGVIAIDVGYPAGDFAVGVGDKAAFFTPVPGGVGPVTVASLFENLLQVAI